MLENCKTYVDIIPETIKEGQGGNGDGLQYN